MIEEQELLAVRQLAIASKEELVKARVELALAREHLKRTVEQTRLILSQI